MVASKEDRAETIERQKIEASAASLVLECLEDAREKLTLAMVICIHRRRSEIVEDLATICAAIDQIAAESGGAWMTSRKMNSG